MPNKLSSLITESRNALTEKIDTLTTLQIVSLINNEDKKVALAVEQTLPAIANAVDWIANAFEQGGRLIYCGAGTSGRLGILDASECPPTYGTAPEQVMGLIAGGETAILKAVEHAEDSETGGAADLAAIHFNATDILVGIAASGRTPYVIGAMHYAKQQGAKVIALSCNPNSPMQAKADLAITPVVGAEVITGSSRMKAGTAQKMVLNMLSSAAMIKIGKVYGNLMVDVVATNQKLVERQISIVMQATDCNREQASQALSQCDFHCKTAILMLLGDLNAKEAQQLLQSNQGKIRQALASHLSGNSL